MLAPAPHPYLIFGVRAEPGLRALADWRADCRHPKLAARVERLRRLADQALAEPPLIAGAMDLTGLLKNRLRSLATAALLWEDPRYAAAALRQIEPMFDRAAWPILWPGNGTVTNRSAPAAAMIALCYDWLWPMLSEAERGRIVEGLDKLAIQPFLITMRERHYPVDRRANQCGSVCGGLGVVAMALADVHPDAPRIIEFVQERMDWLTGVYGPEGEFNESPGYSDALPEEITYFAARRCFSANRDPLLEALHALTKWTLYAIAPGGLYVNHGDSGGCPWRYWFLPAIANLTRDATIQWFYEHYAALSEAPVTPLELMTYDLRLEAVAPEAAGWPASNASRSDAGWPASNASRSDAGWPLDRAYSAWGALVSSRSDWDLTRPRSAVFSKCSIEFSHEHDDAGQVLIFGHGRGLIVDDMGHTYPTGYWDEGRYNFLFASRSAHNIPSFGRPNPRYVFPDTVKRGRLLEAKFAASGGFWRMDLSEPAEGLQVYRTVVHERSGIVAVLDEVSAAAPEEMVWRWHTGATPQVSADGRFSVICDGIPLSGRLVLIESIGISKFDNKLPPGGRQPPWMPIKVAAGVPAGRLIDGASLQVSARSWAVPKEVPDRHKTGRLPFVEAVAHGRSARLLSLFAIGGPDRPPADWQDDGAGAWRIMRDDASARVVLKPDGLHVSGPAGAIHAGAMPESGNTKALSFTRSPPARNAVAPACSDMRSISGR